MVEARIIQYKNRSGKSREWRYKANDNDNIAGRIFFLTQSNELALDIASWCEIGTVGETYEFDNGRVELVER